MNTFLSKKNKGSDMRDLGGKRGGGAVAKRSEISTREKKQAERPIRIAFQEEVRKKGRRLFENWVIVSTKKKNGGQVLRTESRSEQSWVALYDISRDIKERNTAGDIRGKPKR